MAIRQNINFKMLISGTMLSFFFLSSLAYADIYKYTDKYGRVILTDRPKHGGYKRLVKTWKGWAEPKKTKSKVAYHNFLKNQKKYAKAIDQVARQQKLPKPLVHAIITAESSYDPNAISSAGAVGLMQLMPGTAKRYGVKDRKNPYQNLSGGTRYFRDLLKMFDNNVVLALAAYNAGENAVKKYGNKIPPYKETQNYVRKVLAYYKKYKNSPTMG